MTALMLGLEEEARSRRRIESSSPQTELKPTGSITAGELMCAHSVVSSFLRPRGL